MLEFVLQFRLHPVRGKGRSHLRSSTAKRPSIDILLARQRTPGAQGGMMSRDLPARPNLEHLRKQAKDRLRDLRLQNADAKLADAQHAVARDYGFVSWPQLKAYTEALSEPGGDRNDRRDSGRPHPLVGRWEANLSMSTRHPANEYQTATLEISVDGDVVTIHDAVVDAAGRIERTTNTIDADEQEHSSAHGYVVTARRVGERRLEVTVTKKDRIEGRVTYEVSPDGRMLTLVADEQIAVFDRR